MVGKEVLVACLIMLWSSKSSRAGFTLSDPGFLTVEEEVANGTFVTKITAYPDVSRYELVDSRKLFSINEQGNVTVQNRIDRETLGDRCDFTVVAYSNSGEKAQEEIPCVILDVNDHAPRFPSQLYNISVNEKSNIGTMIFSEIAKDEDKENNGQRDVTYEITRGNEGGVFGIQDPYRCNLVLMKELDYETKRTYSLNITAKALKQQRDKLKQYQTKIHLNLEKERQLAKDLLQQGKKDKAKLLLKKKRYQEQLLDRTDNQLDNLEKMVQDVEFAQIQIKVVEGLKQGNEALDQMHQMMSIEDVERIMEETKEAVEYQREIDEMLSGSLSQEDEDAVLQELEDLKKSMSENLPDVPTAEPAAAAGISLPEVPSKEPGEATEKKAVETARQAEMVPA